MEAQEPDWRAVSKEWVDDNAGVVMLFQCVLPPEFCLYLLF